MKLNLEIVVRFHEKWEFQRDTKCWIWTASTAGKGYGQIKIPGTRKQIYAHRLSYLIHCGEIPKGMHVCRVCDTPKCVKPTHLFLGSCEENLQDMKVKDRHLKGVKNKRAKLTDEKVMRIHSLSKEGLSQGKIAEIFQISQGQVWRILKGKRWEHIYCEIYPG